MCSMASWRPVSVLCLLLFALLAASCGVAAPIAPQPDGTRPGPGTGPLPGGGGPAPNPGGGAGTLQGGVLVTLDDSGEQYKIWVTEPAAAQALVDVWSGSIAFTNITGPIRGGSGEAKHNSPWSWHIDPARVLVNIHTFAPVYSEKPSVVEANLKALLAAGEDKMAGNGKGTLRDVQDYR